MSAIDADYIAADDEWDELVWVWQRTDVPKGCKVEIIDGLITVIPLSANAHHGIAERVQRRLYEVIPEDWGVYQRLGMAVPSRLRLYMPDIVVVPERALAGDAGFVPADRAELVVEITSRPTAFNDRTHKAAGCAAAGIPLYLLIDGWAPGGPAITLFGEPADGVYRILRAVGFGDPVKLPEPFGLTIDTAEFPVD
ncbi:Uma2 family endonuclease [Streptomyces sp. NPDC093970]|uniref:Uma2 family endonuclease n=1 Tax=Streptomyces sp. NPDC093970 TaxID=3155076 RepID=UPI0034203CE5